MKTLEEMRRAVMERVKAKGWDDSTASELFMLMLEEAGELSKAVRKRRGMWTERADEPGAKKAVAEELGDLLLCVLLVAIWEDVDPTEAFAEKFLKDKPREQGQGSGFQGMIVALKEMLDER